MRSCALRSAIAFGMLLALVQMPSGVRPEDSSPSLGRFKITYYYVAHERESGSWPLYGSACKTVLARTSREFHHAISREGTGRLLDDRLLNFAERCTCARAGHGGSRICYEVLDRKRFPWGRGSLVAGRLQPLRPFRSVAVDPAVIPLGTVIFIPEWEGKKAPNGERMSGCFRAEDTGRLVRGLHLDVFTGTPRWAREMQRLNGGLGSVIVYDGGDRCRGVFRR